MSTKPKDAVRFGTVGPAILAFLASLPAAPHNPAITLGCVGAASLGTFWYHHRGHPQVKQIADKLVPERLAHDLSQPSSVKQLADGMISLGVATDGPFVVTPNDVGLMLIVGGSGTGKTVTATRICYGFAKLGHLLMIDPHEGSEQSLSSRLPVTLSMPVAFDTEDVLDLLNIFVNELAERKRQSKAGNAPHDHFALVIDEAYAIAKGQYGSDVKDALDECISAAGCQGRKYKMTLIVICQRIQTTGTSALAETRNTSHIIIAHKLPDVSETLKVCQNNRSLTDALMGGPKNGYTALLGTADGLPVMATQPMLSTNEPHLTALPLTAVVNAKDTEPLSVRSLPDDVELTDVPDGRTHGRTDTIRRVQTAVLFCNNHGIEPSVRKIAEVTGLGHSRVGEIIKAMKEA